MQMISWKLMEDAISFGDRLKLANHSIFGKQFTNGPKVKEFEDAWNKWLGSKFSLFVSSGSTANFLLVAAAKEYYGIKSGDKVLLPACTWMTNVAPIIQLGLQPIFCDIQLSDFSFDISELKKISVKHPDIKLIFVTHLLGFSSNARINGTLHELFPKAHIMDDVCESHGCRFETGNKVGSTDDSIGSTFSTYFGHHLTSVEGGFVTTNNPELYDLMKMKRSHGLARESINFQDYASKYPEIDKQFLFVTDGYNFRNTELNAVLGLSQLKKLDNSIEIRNQNYKQFCELMEDYSTKFYPIKYTPTSSNFCLPFITSNINIKQKLQKKLIEKKIEYRPIVSGNLLRHPFLKGYKIETQRKNSNANIIHELGLYIGNNQFVGKKHLQLLEEILDSL